MPFYLCGLFLCALAFTQILAAGDGQFSELEKVALEELRKTNTPGAAVAIVSGDKVIFAKGFGVANVETGAPVTPDMLFRLGSTTKMMTAAVLVGLAEQGKLQLDEQIGKYIRGLAPGLARLTAHQLLSHTAGLKDEAPMDGLHDDSALSARVRGWTDQFLIFEPGKIYSYSNPGYALAGLLIEEAGGKPYADMMSERLFKPLGMDRTTLRPTVAMTYLLSQGHDAREQENGKLAVVRPAPDYAGGWPSGSVFTSVNDFSRLAIAFLNDGRIDGKQALPAPMIHKLSTPYVETYGAEESKYAYGLSVRLYRGVRLLQHGGSRLGYGSQLRMAPEHRFAVIVLANRSGANLGRTVEKATELLLPLKPKEEEKAATQMRATPVLMTAAEMAGYAGRYANGENTWELFTRGGKLYARRQGAESEVTKLGNSWFSVTPPRSTGPVKFHLLTAADGTGEYLHAGGRAHRRLPGK